MPPMPRFMGVVSRYTSRILSAVVKSQQNSKFLSATRSVSVFLANLALSLVVIHGVPYTEIDWAAYMEEVAGFLGGQLDYLALEGRTGPLVYPAGFLYIFSGLYYVTREGSNVRRAQYIFATIHSATIVVVIAIYAMCSRDRAAAQKFPLWMCGILLLSRRALSLYALRLFNDGVQMFFMYGAIALFTSNRWKLGCALYSLSVSIKMNGLLFAPGLAVLLCQARGFSGAIRLILGICVPIQLLLGSPFLYHAPVSYLSRSFELTRQFMHKWSVNGAFVSEYVFADKRVAIALLASHLMVLLLFGNFKWTLEGEGGLLGLIDLQSFGRGSVIAKLWHQERAQSLNANHVACVLFTSNFVGIVFARSLHYQFYLWYVHSLPFLVSQSRLHWIVKLAVLLVIEVVYNIYPPQAFAACCLHLAHFLLLLSLWRTGRATKESVYRDINNFPYKKGD